MLEMISRWLLLIINVTTFISYLRATTIIDRCPGIGVQSIRRESRQYELSFIFYYTSWSNASVEARKIYDEVAQYYNEYYFAEVDCWHLACNCSKTLPLGNGLPDNWPTLIVRYGNTIAMQYHGEWNFVELIRFIYNIHKPIERLHTRNELKALTLKTDAVILGLFQNADSKDYKQFLIASIQWLQIDPNLSLRFAAALGSSCVQFLDKSNKAILPIVLLINNNKIEHYEHNKKLNSSEIMQWLQVELKRSNTIISGYNTPGTIAMHAKRREPVLAIFANDVHSRKNFYTQMQQFVETTQDQKTSTESKCQQTKRNNYQLLQFNNDASNQSNENQEPKTSKCLKHELFRQNNFQYYYAFNEYWNKVWLMSSSNSNINTEYSPSSSITLLKFYQRNTCLYAEGSIATPQLKSSIAKFLKKTSENLQLASQTHGHNQTLAIVILNKAKYKDFLEEQLGMHALKNNAAIVLIFDVKFESTYAMAEPFTFDAIELFMRNYYAKNLQTIKKVSAATAPLQHTTSGTHVVYLDNYNSQILFNHIDQQNTTIVLLLYSPLCALSGVMAHTLTQVAGLLRDSLKELRFFRLDVHANSLPWEYVMTSTPTLLVFPNGRFTESRTFPKHLKPDVRNVMGFILAQLEPVHQVSAILQSCRRYLHVQHRLHKCLEYSRSLVMQHIGHYLKLWQIYERERDDILRHLKSFKDLGLDIQHSFRF